MSVTDDSNLHIIFKYFGLGAAFGDMLGPLISGPLSNLNKKSDFFKVDFIENYPFAPPTTLLGLLASVSFIL